jgi:hypothetical protein
MRLVKGLRKYRTYSADNLCIDRRKDYDINEDYSTLIEMIGMFTSRTTQLFQP